MSRKQEGWEGTEVKNDAINLLVNNIQSIPFFLCVCFKTIDYAGGATAS
jgi:hypothetical protein